MGQIPPADDGASPLDDVVDDTEAREQSAGWAVDQLYAGRIVEDVIEDLIAGGWGRDAAEQIGEEARQRTKSLRSPPTRHDVARAFRAGDPSLLSQSNPAANRGMGGALRGIFSSIRRLWRTKDIGRRN